MKKVKFNVNVCPECGSKDVLSFVDKVDFGQNFTFYAPVRVCVKCNFRWTDTICDELYEHTLKLNNKIHNLLSVCSATKDIFDSVIIPMGVKKQGTLINTTYLALQNVIKNCEEKK